MLPRSFGSSAPRSIADALREEICSGAFIDGDSLPQDALAARLGVSKIPIREALRLLEAEGLVAFQPNRGATVMSLTPSEAQEITEMRLALEPAVLHKAVPHFDKEHARQAFRILEDLDDARSPARLSALNWEFHAALYAPANRPRHIGMIRGLHVLVDRYMRLILSGLKHQRRSQEEHRALLESCTARRGNEAARILRDHIQDAAEILLSHLGRRAGSASEAGAKRSGRSVA